MFEEVISHFNEVNNKDHKRYCCQDAAKRLSKIFAWCYSSIKRGYRQFLPMLSIKLSRLVFPGKLISDVPKEIKPVGCSDVTASCSDNSSQYIYVRARAETDPRSHLLLTYQPEAISFETDNLPDTIQPLHYQYLTDFDNECLVSLEETKQGGTSLRISYFNSVDVDSLIQEDITLPQPSPYLSAEVVSSLHTTSTCTNVHSDEECQTNRLQSEINKQKSTESLTNRYVAK